MIQLNVTYIQYIIIDNLNLFKFYYLYIIFYVYNFLTI